MTGQVFQSHGFRWRPVTWTMTDFDAGVDNGSAAGTAGDVLEVATAEVGTDNQFSQYNAAMFGQPASDGRKSGEVTEWLVHRHNSTTSEVNPAAEFNIITRAKAKRDGDDITGFMRYRQLNQTTPSEQLGLPIQSKIGRDGFIVAVHYRDQTSTNGVAWQGAAGDEKALVPGFGGTKLG